jgi:flagellar biosynthesis protein FlhG
MISQPGSSVLHTDQARRLRQLARERSSTAYVIAVTSGKGGVGKSNIAVNLSICLAAQSLKVTLVDVDLGLANADLLMNIQPRHSLADVLSGARSIDQVVVQGPGGIRFVPGAAGHPEWANLADFGRRNLIHQIQKLVSSTDIVVLDCGAGISSNVLAFALSADEVIVVTTPQPTALTDAYATMKALTMERYVARLSVLVNMAFTQREALGTYHRLEKVAQRFLQRPIASRGYILHDTTVELAVRERCPFVIRYPGSNASTCLSAIAMDLLRERRVQGGVGFWKRVVGLFA